MAASEDTPSTVVDSEEAAVAVADPPGPDEIQAEALLRSGSVTEEAIDRAQRIRKRMESPQPLGEVLVELGALSQEELDRVERTRRSQMSLVDILLEDGNISPEAVATYREAKAQSPSPPDRTVLLGGGLVTEVDYLRAVGAKLDVPFIEPEIGEIQSDLYDKVPIAYLLKNLALPLRVEGNLLQLAVAHPEDESVIIEIERTFGSRVERFCATTSRITETLRTLERLRGKVSDSDSFKIQYRELDHAAASRDETGEEAIQLVDYLLSRAVQMEASDLHIEPSLNKIRVRVRVDGVMHPLTDLPGDFVSRVTARIKILAGMDVTEKRLHQDGKIYIKLEGKEIDIRVSTYVSMFGETVVMRLLDRARGILPLGKVGFQPRAYATLDDVVLQASSGLVLLVGPTGSGKTTTLYSFIDHANDPTEKVITCEDPVEYVIDGIVQCSVNERTGPTFPDSLRAIVRQDPDTIVVGEIRDQTTAKLAVESALTGHKVFSTFHTEEAVGAFIRLLEMGVEPFLVASTVSAVIAQRLVRRLCPECSVPLRPTAAQLRFLNTELADLEGTELLGPSTCAHCSGTGFKGRVAIHEVLVPDDEFRHAVLASASAAELRLMARKLPAFLTMQEDGLLKAAQGITSLSEVIENAPRDTAARPLSVIRSTARSRRIT